MLPRVLIAVLVFLSFSRCITATERVGARYIQDSRCTVEDIGLLTDQYVRYQKLSTVERAGIIQALTEEVAVNHRAGEARTSGTSHYADLVLTLGCALRNYPENESQDSIALLLDILKNGQPKRLRAAAAGALSNTGFVGSNIATAVQAAFLNESDMLTRYYLVQTQSGLPPNDFDITMATHIIDQDKHYETCGQGSRTCPAVGYYAIMLVNRQLIGNPQIKNRLSDKTLNFLRHLENGEEFASGCGKIFTASLLEQRSLASVEEQYSKLNFITYSGQFFSRTLAYYDSGKPYVDSYTDYRPARFCRGNVWLQTIPNVHFVNGIKGNIPK